ncbi:superoxide dismutase, Fe-Mn family [Enhydrobacter aerosaccus]|uniref:Superoxide dismutase n=1 Tax=Enhydrobacter aerosaccus TaxID=225324 RepID=A0A1T4RMS1_9HYPH|nr:superoxide dismutase [Enhydrobacter aerosaccus]SKA17187.1 superoxide dismutase, Fe-Mn family [Enhydrobacter aerosaccus]
MPSDKPNAFSLPKLPYADNALEPVVSAKTISFHYGKHHAAYVNNLNGLVPGSAYEGLSLEEIVKKSAKNDKDKAIFNNAGQIWNHNFYWESMSPKGGEPTGKLKDAIQSSFGGVKEFKEAFQKAAVGQFGSGWAWLVKGADGKLKITTTSNADTPIAHGETPLLTVDVWEHAYYLDYQNRRPDHVKDLLDKVVNWAFAEKNLG